jgi:hypothetical protein
MKTFTDNAGRTWTIALNIDTARRIKSLADVDIMGFVEGDLLERVLRSPLLLFDVVYAACREQADAQHVTPEDFGKAMGGAAIVAAREALVAEIVDFFPQEGPTIRRQADKLASAYRKLLAAVSLKIDGIDEDQLIAAALLAQTTSGNSPGSLPASPASTPAP